MTYQIELLAQVTSLRTAGPSTRPKLHKPLLVALLLTRYIHAGHTTATYADIADTMQHLIAQFDPPRSSRPRPVYPFWRLQSDGFWTIRGAEKVQLTSKGDPSPRALTSEHIGSWTPAAIRQLAEGAAVPALEAVLARYFSPTIRTQLRQELDRLCG